MFVRPAPPRTKRDVLILLHGLGRTRWSLTIVAQAFAAAGWHVINRSYPSRRANLAALAEIAVGGSVAAAPTGARLNFVTHSMGGLLLRSFYAARPTSAIRRTVMLAPPSGGSEIVDLLQRAGIAEPLLGPAGAGLGTGPQDAPARLPALAAEHGVISGSRTINPLTSALIEGENDGKVSVARARSPSAADHIVLPLSHTLMPAAPETIRQIDAFLSRGRFDRTRRRGRADAPVPQAETTAGSPQD